MQFLKCPLDAGPKSQEVPINTHVKILAEKKIDTDIELHSILSYLN